MELTYVLEDSLGDDDVELLVLELDWHLQEIDFDQVGRWFLYRYVDAVIVDVPV